METERMLVTQGLNELKTLDARIRRATYNAEFVASAKTSDKKVTPAVTKEDFSKEATASLYSINDLIDRRERIKTAIVESNANTMVEICGDTYSVAKVIDMKSSIEYREALLAKMESQYNNAVAKMNRENMSMEQKIDQLVATAFGKESKSSVKDGDYDSIANPYRASNEYSLVDPVDIKRQIEELRTFIDEFKSTVDSKLQVSNCATYIEF